MAGYDDVSRLAANYGYLPGSAQEQQLRAMYEGPPPVDAADPGAPSAAGGGGPLRMAPVELRPGRLGAAEEARAKTIAEEQAKVAAANASDRSIAAQHGQGTVLTELGAMGSPERIARNLANAGIRNAGAIIPGAGALATGLGVAPGTLADSAVPAPGIERAAPAEQPSGVAGATFADPPAGYGGGYGGGGVVKVSAGGRTPSQWQVQEGLPTDPRVTKLQDKANKEREEALLTEARAGQAQAEKEAAFAKGYEHRIAFHDEQAAIAREERMRKLEAETERVNQELESASVYEPRDMIGKGVASFFSTIATSLGAYASPYTGGRNLPAEQIASDVERHLKEQRLAMDKGNNYLARLRQQFGDQESAENVMRAALMDRAKTEIATLVAGSKSEAMKGRAAAVMADLDERKAAVLDAQSQRAMERVTRADVNAPAQYMQLGGGGLEADKKAKENAEKYGEALTKAGIPEAVQGMAAVEAQINAFSKEGVVEGVSGGGVIRGEFESRRPSSSLSPRGRINRQLVDQFTQNYRKAMSGAGFSKEEAQGYEAVIRGAKTTEELQAAIRRAHDVLGARLRTMQATYDPKGVALFNQRTGGTIARFASEADAFAPTVRPAGEERSK